jgi:hypothetical protein
MRFLIILILCVVYCTTCSTVILAKETTPATNVQHTLARCQIDTERVTCYLKLASIHNNISYTDSALQLLTLINKRAHYTLKFINTAVGNAHVIKANLYTNNYLNAITELNAALVAYTKAGDLRHEAAVLQLIGVQYLKIQLYNKALFYFNKSLVLQTNDNINDSTCIMETYCNTGICYASNNSYYKALQTILPAYNYFTTTHNKKLLFETGCLLGEIYIITQNKNKARSILQQTELNIDAKTPAKELFYFYVELADLNEESNKLNIALNYLNKANLLKKALNATDVRLLTLKYALLYKRLQRYKIATEYYTMYTQQTDSIFNTNTINTSIGYQTKYETLEKENKILQLSKTSALQQLSLQQQQARNTLLIWFALFAIVVITALVALAYWLRKYIRTLNVLNAHITNNTVLLTQQASTISRYQSQMNPHFIFNAINSIQGLLLNNENKLVYSQLDALSVLMRQTLNNSNVEYITLAQEINYLNNYVQFEQANAKFEFKFDIAIPTTINADDVLLPPMLLQPFIENCIKHGSFDTVINPCIQLHVQLQSATIISITITDNGKGLVKNKNVQHASRALTIVEQRLNLCFKSNAIICTNCLTTHSTNNGYSVTIKLPYLENY